jgi:hypothetical protein
VVLSLLNNNYKQFKFKKMKKLSFVLAALLITGIAFADKKCCKKSAAGKACCKKEAAATATAAVDAAPGVITPVAATATKSCCKKAGASCAKKETATAAATPASK